MNDTDIGPLSLDVDVHETHMGNYALEHGLDGFVFWMILPRVNGWRSAGAQQFGMHPHQTYVKNLDDVIDDFCAENRTPREIAVVDVNSGQWRTVASAAGHDPMYPTVTDRGDTIAVDEDRIERIECAIDRAWGDRND